MTAEQYDAILERFYQETVNPDPTLEMELCFESKDQMKVSLLFDPKENCKACLFHKNNREVINIIFLIIFKFFLKIHIYYQTKQI